MFKLVIKDFLIQKKSFPLVLFYSAFALIVFNLWANQQISATYMMGSVGITFILLQTACMNDEKNKSEKILISLPVNRREIVFAKYLSGLLFSVINLIIMGSMGLVLAQLINRNIAVIRLADVMVSFSMGLLLVLLFLPIFFKVGHHKGRFVTMIIFMFFFFAPVNLMKYLLNSHSNGALVKVLLELITKGFTITTASVFLGGMILLLILSLRLSLGFYEKREF